MITRVDSVMIANAACPASYSTADALKVGEVALFDENKNILTDGEKSVAANSVYVGVCKGTMKVVNPQTGALEDKKEIEFSNEISCGCVYQKYNFMILDKIRS